VRRDRVEVNTPLPRKRQVGLDILPYQPQNTWIRESSAE
jgi:hypothetical protein